MKLFPRVHNDKETFQLLKNLYSFWVLVHNMYRFRTSIRVNGLWSYIELSKRINNVLIFNKNVMKYMNKINHQRHSLSILSIKAIIDSSHSSIFFIYLYKKIVNKPENINSSYFGNKAVIYIFIMCNL